MTIKFKGKTISQYKGLDGFGGLMVLEKNDIAEVSKVIGELLIKHYNEDFELIITPKPKHAPKSDKQAKKTAKFKSK